MYVCYEDGGRQGRSYLVSDPSVSCEASLSRTVVNLHSAALVALVGVSFPLISFFKIRTLKNAGKLDFDEGFANLYQFYNTRLPYFER